MINQILKFDVIFWMIFSLMINDSTASDIQLNSESEPYGFENFEYLGTFVGRHTLPPKIVKITKTVAVKVPIPYPVKVPHSVPYPVPIERPYPVHIPKIIKIKEQVPVPLHDNQVLQQEHHANTVIMEPNYTPSEYGGGVRSFSLDEEITGEHFSSRTRSDIGSNEHNHVFVKEYEHLQDQTPFGS